MCEIYQHINPGTSCFAKHYWSHYKNRVDWVKFLLYSTNNDQNKHGIFSHEMTLSVFQQNSCQIPPYINTSIYNSYFSQSVVTGTFWAYIYITDVTITFQKMKNIHPTKDLPQLHLCGQCSSNWHEKRHIHPIYSIQCPPLILAPLVNMSKGGCENKSALFILFIFHSQNSQNSNLSLK